MDAATASRCTPVFGAIRVNETWSRESITPPNRRREEKNEVMRRLPEQIRCSLGSAPAKGEALVEQRAQQQDRMKAAEMGDGKAVAKTDARAWLRAERLADASVENLVGVPAGASAEVPVHRWGASTAWGRAGGRARVWARVWADGQVAGFVPGTVTVGRKAGDSGGTFGLW